MTSSSSKRKVKPVAAGCVVSWADFEIVLISFTCFAAFIIYGASNAALGASVPALARALDKPESRIGFIFIFRGAGFLTGTLGSAALMGYETLPLSKEVITCLASILMGIMTYLMSCTDSYNTVLFLSVFQGLGFGGIDCISNCLFPELWGVRIQPWMQALHLCFGIGAMIGPTLVGSVGYVATYRVLGVLAFLPLVALQGYRFFASAANTAKLLTGADSNSSATIEGQVQNETSFKYVSTSITEDDEMGMDNTYSPFTGRGSREEAGDRNSESNLNGSSNSLSSMGTSDTEGDSTKSSQSDTPAAAGPPVTLTLRMLILFFYVIYTGSEAGYAGWIPVYVLQEGITNNDSHAAYVAATFWATMTIGRMLAVFTAMAFSATFMLRFHLSFTAICCTMFMFVEKVGTLNYALTVAALMGLALSAIYPLVMTIVIDYGYTM
jgi:fucose permease